MKTVEVETVNYGITELWRHDLMILWRLAVEMPFDGSAYKSVKQRVDAIDKENFTYSYNVIEGNALMGVFESISYHIKIVASPDGGSIYKNKSIYQTKADAQVTEEEIKSGKEKATGMFKALEAYLLANPEA